MPFVPAKCPECGGNVVVNSENDAWICDFCKTPFIVEKAIHNFNTVNNITNNVTNEIKADVVNVYETKESDFIIKGGTLVEYIGEAVDVVIPNNVVSIGTGAFKNCAVKSVKIPKSVDKIEDYAFDECEYLKVVEFESTTKNHEIFKGCTAIEKIKYDNMSFWNEETWYYYWETGELKKCYALRDDDEGRVFVPEGTDRIVEQKGYGNYQNYRSNRKTFGNIHEVILPDSVKEIGKRAFYLEKKLKKINLPDNTKAIEDLAFYKCELLEEIVLPNSLEMIGSRAFGGCKSLKTICIPGSVKVIGDGAFIACSSLETVIIEDGIEIIDEHAFGNCYNLVKMLLPKSLKKIIPAKDSYESCDTIDSHKLEIVDASDDIVRKNITAFSKNNPFSKGFAQKYCPKCGGDYVGVLKKKCSNCGYEKPKS